MYGNFDAIKRRAKLRKETTSARQDKVNSRKGNLSSMASKKDTFPEIDKDKLAQVIGEIKEQFDSARKREHLLYVSLILISITILGLLAWKFIFSE